MHDGGSGAGIELSLKVKALAALFAAGATLVLITIALPHDPGMYEAGLLVVCANAYLVAGGMVRLSARLPERLLPVVLAWGSVLVTAVAYFSDAAPSPLVFFYLWVFLYAGYFFTRAQIVAQIACVGVLYGGLLALVPAATGSMAWWIVGMGAMSVAAALIVTMRGHVEELIARLHDAARTDPLTQLQNRRGFRESLDLEIERARRSGAEMALLVGDLDHFKLVNDSLGHAVGDAALRRVADILRDGHRGIDACARVGGEEFALVLPNTDEPAALHAAERLRAAIAHAFEDAPMPLTISFGIATFPTRADTAGALLRASDEALYAAKHSGRNRAVVHSRAVAELSDGTGMPAREVESERYLATVLDLAEAVDIRFSGSARHCETVGRYAEIMARSVGLPAERVARVRLAGVLHDVGKIGVPDAILRKPGRLDEAEWITMKNHAALGAQILEHPSLQDVQRWVRAHHERVDGSGYPDGLSGDDLPLEARILAVADAYEAMTSDRCYSASIGSSAARDELRRCAGSQFDPEVVDAFIRALDAEVAEALRARSAKSGQSEPALAG